MVTDGDFVVWIDSSTETLWEVNTAAQLYPVQLAALNPGDGHLALDDIDGYVFWTRVDGSSLELWNATIKTSDSAAVYAAFDPAGGVSAVDGLVFDTDSYNLWGLAVSSGHGQFLLSKAPNDCTPAGGWNPMASDSFGSQMLYGDHHLFWADWGARAVRGWAEGTDGGVAIDYGTAEAQPDYLATDATYLYWTNLAGGGMIRRSKVLAATPEAETVGTAGANVSGLAAGNGVVYFAVPADDAGAGGIFQIASPGATPTVVVSATQAGTAHPLRFAAGALYWGDDTAKAIYKLPLN
jgi:hypothetical protein